MLGRTRSDHLRSATPSHKCHQSFTLLTADMISAAAQSFNLKVQAIFDGHQGFGDDSKLNSLALVYLVVEASDHSRLFVINLDSPAGN